MYMKELHLLVILSLVVTASKNDVDRSNGGYTAVTDAYIPNNVTRLDLSGNAITTLDDGDFSAFKTLEVLDLSNNSIRIIKSETFAGIYSLISLNLSYNNIQVFPILENSFSLRYLDLASNNITELSYDMLVSFTDLEELDLNSNILRYFRNASHIYNYRRKPLRAILTNNEWDCTCDFWDILINVDSPGIFRSVISDEPCQTPTFLNGKAWGEITHTMLCEGPCPDLNQPTNGYLECNNWDRGKYCRMKCNDQFDIPRNAPVISENYGEWMCEDTHGSWLPTAEVPDCTVMRRPSFLYMPLELLYFSEDCSQQITQNQVKEKFIAELDKSKYSSLCTSYEACTADRVEVTCGPELGWSFEYTHSIRINFRIRLKMTYPDLFTSDDTVSLLTYVDTHFSEIAALVNEDVVNGIMDLSLPWLNTKIDVDSLKYSPHEMICDIGMDPHLKTFSCAMCPKGTFYNPNATDCIPCDTGTYQNEDGQLSCKQCPVNTSTLQRGSATFNQCVDKCYYGYFSEHGLVECTICPLGTYVDHRGATNCTACPNNKTTLSIGSTDIEFCVYDDEDTRGHYRIMLLLALLALLISLISALLICRCCNKKRRVIDDEVKDIPLGIDDEEHNIFGNSPCHIVSSHGGENEFPKFILPNGLSQGPATFYEPETKATSLLNYMSSTNNEEWPNLGPSGRIVSHIGHLLPHGRRFTKPITIDIKVEKSLKYGVDNMVLLYSNSAPNCKPHWEIIPAINRSDPARRVLEMTVEHCVFTMPTLCLVCVGELGSDDLQRCEKSASIFHVDVDLMFEAEYVTHGDSEKWLVKVKVLLSRNNCENQMTPKNCFKAVKDSILGDIRVHVNDIVDGWTLVDPQLWEDITTFQLDDDRNTEIMFSFNNDNARGDDTFNVRVRLHQENARNDCGLVLKTSSILRNMVMNHPPHRQEYCASCQAPSRSPNSAGASAMPLTARQYPLVADFSTILPDRFDRYASDIASVIDPCPTDSGELISLCNQLGLARDLTGLLRRAYATSSPTRHVLIEWKGIPGVDLQILQDIHETYFPRNQATSQ